MQEGIHKVHVTLHAPVANFTRIPDGSVKASYQFPDDTETSSSNILPFSQSMVILPIETETYIHVFCFYPDGKKRYVDKINDHFIWDVAPERCDVDSNCDDYSDEDDYVPLRRRSKNKQRCKSSTA